MKIYILTAALLGILIGSIATKYYDFSTSSNNNISKIPCTEKAIENITEGPYYKAHSPESTDVYKKTIPGTKITVSGYVLDTSCTPIKHAWIDFWQTNGKGDYDNKGYTLRAHQYTDSQGKYTYTTVIPGEYTGRTPHIHVKVRVNENTPIYTTQLFLPNENLNTSDELYNKALEVTMINTPHGLQATYNFILKTN